MNPSTRTKITVAAFAIAIVGLILEIVPYFVIDADMQMLTPFRYVWFFKAVYLNIDVSRNFDLGVRNQYGFPINLMTIFYFLLLLIGAIDWVASQYRNTRLLTFCFSLIFIQSVAWLVILIFALPFSYGDYGQEFTWWFWIVSRLVQGAWIYGSWWLVVALRKTSVLETRVAKDTGVAYFVPTKKSTRLFHVMLDFVVCILLLSFVSNYPLQGFLKMASDAGGERLALWTLFLLIRFSYYLVSEAFFSTSPAKLLTQSRVVNDSGARPHFGQILARTAVRFVPFEPWSFIAPSGWHDKWTSTEVADEDVQGRSGGRYFWLLGFFVVYALGSLVFSVWTRHW